ncbi:MAG: MMPL family transporter, partial [Nocardioides sp.]
PISDVEEVSNPVEVMGLVAALIVLLIVFGSVIAAGLPIVTAISGFLVGGALVGVATHLVKVPDFAPTISAMIGIGVGIDYALLILTRYRAARFSGLDTPAALSTALTTAGHAVVVAGLTVVTALLALLAVGVESLTSLGVACAATVLIVVAASMTLLPALLAVLGPRIDRLRLLRRPEPTIAREPRAARLGHTAQRHPWLALALGALVLAPLAASAGGLRLGIPDDGNNPTSTTTYRAYQLVREAFGPGFTGPLTLVATDVAAERLVKLRQAIEDTPGVAEVIPGPTSADGRTSTVSVVPTTSPQDTETETLVATLREDVIPTEIGASAGDVLVTGGTAANIDQTDAVAARIPLFLALTVGAALVLLVLAFRSILVGVKAAVMNLAAIAAAYGVVALFAQGGLLGGLIGIDSPTPVPAIVPVLMFAILFGLSMDYEVFLLTRIREEYRRSGNTSAAVTEALRATAGVITAAAVIMIVVFLAFVADYDVFVKLAGVGLAAAILLDATVIRLILVPAVMELLGDRNWWLPRWLERRLPAERPLMVG